MEQDSYFYLEIYLITLSKGIYNETYFENNPEERDREGVLYGIVLVNTKTFERECIKVGIASGKDWRHIIKRSRGFRGYDIRIQKVWSSTLYNVWAHELYLHEMYKQDKYVPMFKFGGHTECFKIDSLILQDFPKNKS